MRGLQGAAAPETPRLLRVLFLRLGEVSGHSGETLLLWVLSSQIQVDQAANVIRDMYGDARQKVRVEHAVKQIPPRSLEVAFEVIQLN
jgi:hypothetical protein